MISGVVAALDADVLVPIVACDFLLTAFDLAIFEPVVSAEVLEEVERTLIGDFSAPRSYGDRTSSRTTECTTAR